MRDWRVFMESIMKDLGQESNLTNDIYPLVEERGRELGTEWQAGVRRTLETNSSDCDAWSGEFDLFELKDKGSGNWILRNLVDTNIKDQINQDQDQDQDQVEEGDDETKVRKVWHLRRERSSKIVRKKKLSVLNEKGYLSCEICSFKFETLYGDRGKDFIECHHIIPLSELEPATLTKLEDLALLCSNCHRMIHKKKDTSLDDLRTEMGLQTFK